MARKNQTPHSKKRTWNSIGRHFLNASPVPIIQTGYVYGTTIASRAGSVCGLGVDWNRNRNWPCPVRESTRTWRSLGSHIWTAEKKERRKPNNSHVITVRRSINLSNTPTPRITNSCERHLKKWSILQLLAKIAVHHFIQLYDAIFVLFVIGLFSENFFV
jgi:hypothetical protein